MWNGCHHCRVCRQDFRENAEKARQALNGTMRNGRMLKVRFSAMGCTLKVKRLSAWVSNELLEMAFSIFGELERSTVVVDERGKSTGVGIVEFAKKPCALFCLKKCTESSFFLTESVPPPAAHPHVMLLCCNLYYLIITHFNYLIVLCTNYNV